MNCILKLCVHLESKNIFFRYTFQLIKTFTMNVNMVPESVQRQTMIVPVEVLLSTGVLWTQVGSVVGQCALVLFIKGSSVVRLIQTISHLLEE